MRRLFLFLPFLVLGEPVQPAVLTLKPIQIERLQIGWRRPEACRFYPIAYGFAQVVPLPGSVWQLEAPLAGRVEEVDRLPGEPVSPGDPLILLSSPLLLDLEERLLLAEREWQAARAHYLRLKPLRGSLARGRWLELEKRWREALDRRRAARDRLLQIGYTEAQIEALLKRGKTEGRLLLKAGQAGRIEAILVERGAWVEAGRALLRLLPEEPPLLLEVVLPTRLARKVGPGDRLSWPGGEATVLQKGAVTDPATQTDRLYAKPTAGALQPGERLIVLVERRSEKPLWRLPSSALFRYRGRFWLFTRTERGFEPHPVSPRALFGGEAYLELLPFPSEVVVSGTVVLKSLWLEKSNSP